MAINNNFFSVNGLNNLLNFGDRAYAEVEQKYLEAEGEYDVIKASIKRLLRLLKEIEKNESSNILSKFKGPPKTGDDLKRLFLDFYKNVGLDLFSGFNLKRELQKYELAKEQSALDVIEVADLIMGEVLDELNIAISNPNSETIKKIYAMFHKRVQEIIGFDRKFFDNGSFQGILSLTKAERGFGKGTDFGSAVYKDITVPLRKRLELIAKNRDRIASKDKKYAFLGTNIDIKTTSISENKASYEVTIGEKIAKETEFKSLSDARKLPDQEVERINNEIIRTICSKVKTSYQGDLENFIKNQMTMSPEGKYMFFVGRSSTQLVGILGEISAFYAISNLLSDEYSKRALSWVAQNRVKGKELSIDIVIKNVAGIQVKNSQQEFSRILGLEFNFVDASAEYIFSKLGFDQAAEPLANILTSADFNTPYAFYGNKYHEVPYAAVKNQDFPPVHFNIRDLSYKIMNFMRYFSPEFIYMANDKGLEDQLAILEASIQGPLGGNGSDIYIVNGIPFLASEMLQDITKDLQSYLSDYTKTKFLSIQKTLTTSLEKESKSGESSKNIVSYLNKYSSNRKRGEGTAKKYYSKIRSSYVFQT